MVAAFVKRPISPLHFETLSYLPEDILCSGSDGEHTLEGHRDKRQRIEALGQQYLQGRPLFILSAALRGPLEDGWINPWASKPHGPADDGESAASELRRKATSRGTDNSATLGNPRSARRSVRSDSSNSRRGPLRDADNSKSKFSKSVVKKHSKCLRMEHEEAHQQKLRSETLPQVQNDPINTLERQKDGFPPTRTQPLPATDDQHKESVDWLKSDTRFLKNGFGNPSRSPTPTPANKTYDKKTVNANATNRHRSVANRPPVTLEGDPHQKQDLFHDRDHIAPKTVHAFGFTPINGPTPWRENTESRAKPTEDEKTLLFTLSKESKARKRETTLAAAQALSERGSLSGAQRHPLEPVDQTKLEDKCWEARKPSKAAAQRASQGCVNSQLPETTLGHDKIVDGSINAEASSTRPSESPVRFLNAAPPSANLSAFQYRYANKRSYSSSTSSESSAFSEELKAAKAKAKARATKKLSFTGSGNVKDVRHQKGSKDYAATLTRSSQHSPLVHVESSCKEDLSEVQHMETVSLETSIPLLSTSEGQFSTPQILPEAQVVSEPPGQFYQVPSAPSTNLLETDKQSIKFPSTEEVDSESHLSTQAAILQAQRSFQINVLSAIKESKFQSTHGIRKSSDQDSTPIMDKNDNLVFTPSKIWRNSHMPAGGQLPAAEDDDNEPMSTQDMVDAITPFALTTVKKLPPKKRASFATSPISRIGFADPGSPTVNFDAPGFNMSTSPDTPTHPPILSSAPRPLLSAISKQTSSISHPTVTSSLASFSIAPNGTLTEVYQQDGQKSDVDWDLERAIDEAGSFLGEWDVDAEVRKVGTGSSGSAAGKQAVKGVLTRGKKY
ncbi:hypothetical protein MMC12_006204 [Toensbergia leucococca]|nr:hypothetical protein [Toensbergia leucococca]